LEPTHPPLLIHNITRMMTIWQGHYCLS
jgi:hypothetical protein